MKASDARSENLDGGIDADLTHDRQSILDKFTTSWFQFLLENSLQCWVSYGTIWTSSPIEGPLCLHNLHSLLCQAKRFWLQVLQFLWCQTGQRDLLGGCFLAWIENMGAVSTWFHVHCAKASCRPGTKQPGDSLTIEFFFQQTNAFDSIWNATHVKVARVPQKAKRQEVAFLAQHSLLEPVLECCHFLCKAPQQPKGSVGRLFLGSDWKKRSKTLVGQF